MCSSIVDSAATCVGREFPWEYACHISGIALIKEISGPGCEREYVTRTLIAKARHDILSNHISLFFIFPDYNALQHVEKMVEVQKLRHGYIYASLLDMSYLIQHEW